VVEGFMARIELRPGMRVLDAAVIPPMKFSVSFYRRRCIILQSPVFEYARGPALSRDGHVVYGNGVRLEVVCHK